MEGSITFFKTSFTFLKKVLSSSRNSSAAGGSKYLLLLLAYTFNFNLHICDNVQYYMYIYKLRIFFVALHVHITIFPTTLGILKRELFQVFKLP